MDNEKELPVIYGITDHETEHGVQAYAIDGQTGEILETHFCSSVNFAKSDLGFSGPLFEKVAFSNDEHCTVQFNRERLGTYSDRYPDGYRLEWVGHWTNNPKTIELWERQMDNFDDEIPVSSQKEKVEINLHEYWRKCGDGCCDDYGTIVKVNGVETPSRNQDVETILRDVLEHLGYEVDITSSYDHDN